MPPMRNGPRVCPSLKDMLFKDMKAALFSSGAMFVIMVISVGMLSPWAAPISPAGIRALRQLGRFKAIIRARQ